MTYEYINMRSVCINKFLIKYVKKEHDINYHTIGIKL